MLSLRRVSHGTSRRRISHPQRSAVGDTRRFHVKRLLGAPARAAVHVLGGPEKMAIPRGEFHEKRPAHAPIHRAPGVAGDTRWVILQAQGSAIRRSISGTGTMEGDGVLSPFHVEHDVRHTTTPRDSMLGALSTATSTHVEAHGNAVWARRMRSRSRNRPFVLPRCGTYCGDHDP